MTSFFRKTIGCVLAALALAAAVGVHSKSSPDASVPHGYLDHPVRLIAPYAPGGTVDALARELSISLSTMLGKTFIVENKPGASGNVGLLALAKSAPDGYTLGLAAANMLATNRALYKSLPFDTIKDFAPVGMIGKVPYVLVVHPSMPVHNLKEFIAELKAHPGKYSYGSSGQGNTANIFGELFKLRTGTQMVHVPYKSSGEALRDLLAGRIQIQFFTPVDLMPYIQSGALRPIAVASSRRLAELPDTPTLKESGIEGFETPTWFGVIAPAGTPADIVAFLNAQMRRAMAQPEMAKRLAQAGVEPMDMSPAEFGAFIREEVAHWAQAVKESGVIIE